MCIAVTFREKGGRRDGANHSGGFGLLALLGVWIQAVVTWVFTLSSPLTLSLPASPSIFIPIPTPVPSPSPYLIYICIFICICIRICVFTLLCFISTFFKYNILVILCTFFKIVKMKPVYTVLED